MRLSRRDLSKFAQTKEKLENIGSTTVCVEPANRYVSEAVEMLQRNNPDVLHDITDIRTDLDKGVYGEYIPDSPHSVHLNMTKIESKVKSELSGQPQQDIDIEIVRQTAMVISHESGHQHGYTNYKDTSEAPAEQRENETRKKI